MEGGDGEWEGSEEGGRSGEFRKVPQWLFSNLVPFRKLKLPQGTCGRY